MIKHCFALCCNTVYAFTSQDARREWIDNDPSIRKEISRDMARDISTSGGYLIAIRGDKRIKAQVVRLCDEQGDEI
jgi:hypothetical protein